MSTSNKIPFINAMLMSVNIMVGGGILAGPGSMAAVAGSWSFIGWIIVALLLLPVVLSITRMAEVLPSTNGFSSYCEAGLGKSVGYLGGWIYFVGYSCAAAAILSVYRFSLLKIFPTIAFFESPVLFFASVALLLLVLNNLKISLLGSIQSYLTIVKLTPVLIAICLLPFFLNSNLSFSTSELMAVPLSLNAAMFGFLGFEFCASMTKDIEGGAKMARKAILAGFLAVTLIYVVFHFSLINIMGAEGLALKLAPGFPFFVSEKFALLGRLLLFLIPATTIITYFNSSNGLLTLDSTVLAGIADSKRIRFASFLSLKNIYDRSYVSVFFATALVFTLALLIPSCENLMAVTTLAVNFVFLIANISLWNSDKKASCFNRIINILASIILVGLLGYSFFNAGPTMAIRLQNVMLLIIATMVGLVLYKKE